MEEKKILKGDCECCGPSQAGPEPLPSPQKITEQKSFLVERPSAGKVIDPGTPETFWLEYNCSTISQPFPAAELQKNQEVKGLLDSGVPYVAVFRVGENNLKLIPGNGADGITVAGLLHYAIKQC